jgi:phenylpyruvate tautomerase PptA (4-oxalocrotonate tautomerase family)
VKEESMPLIRVNCPKGALSADQKAALAPRPVQALIRQEIGPITELGTAATGFFFNEVDVERLLFGRGSTIRASRQGVLDRRAASHRGAAG